jgi:CRISPR-associated protein Csm4
MNMNACLLRFQSGLHLGERENWREGTGVFVRSDTLFSAFCHGYRLLYGEGALLQLLGRFREGEPPFLISSTFPYWQETCYLPVPRCQIPRDKEQKKIAFVGLDEWTTLIRGGSLADLGPEAKVLPRQGEPLVPWVVRDIPRVGLNRRTAHPDEAFFFFGEVWYREDAGLYFFFEAMGGREETRFKAVWRLLAQEGLGGDRTAGRGHFHPPEFRGIPLEAPDEASHLVCLSLYYPGPEELAGLTEGYYEMVDRRGYIFSPAGQSLRRRPIRCFAEGSVFPATLPRWGLLVDVTPEAFTAHRVYRYGLLFSRPCALPGGVS